MGNFVSYGIGLFARSFRPAAAVKPGTENGPGTPVLSFFPGTKLTRPNAHGGTTRE